MRTLLFDGSHGAAGDMILGSLLMQVDQKAFLEAMDGFSEIDIHIEPVHDQGVSGLSVSILPKKDIQERHLHDIMDIIEKSGLPRSAKDDGMAVFRKLAVVESNIHRVDMEKLHFHEVGALDSIGDIMGACLLFSMIGAERVLCSPLNLGSGKVRCAHGILDVPAPAVKALTEQVPTCQEGEGERTTPTAAALLSHFVTEFQDAPWDAAVSVGVGFGKRMYHNNYLRSCIIEE